MADPLSIAASIVGLLGFAANLCSTLNTISSSTTEAPALTDLVYSEIKALEGLFLRLNDFVHGKLPTTSNQHIVSVEQLAVTLTGCCQTFTLLKKEVDSFRKWNGGGAGVGAGSGKPSWAGRLLWPLKAPAIRSLLQQLQQHKTSLILIFQIMSSQSTVETQNAMKDLATHIETILANNEELRERMKLLQLTLDSAGVTGAGHDDVSIIVDETSSTTHTATLDAQIPLPTISKESLVPGSFPPYEEALRSSPVYGRYNLSYGTTSTTTFRSSIAVVSSRRSRARSSLADVCDISVVELPLCSDELASIAEFCAKSDAGNPTVVEETATIKSSHISGYSRSGSIAPTTKEQPPAGDVSERLEVLEIAVQREVILKQLEQKEAQRQTAGLEELVAALCKKLDTTENRLYTEQQRRVAEQRELRLISSEKSKSEAKLDHVCHEAEKLDGMLKALVKESRELGAELANLQEEKKSADVLLNDSRAEIAVLAAKLESAGARNTMEQQALTKKLEDAEARHTTEQRALTKKLEDAKACHITEQRKLTKKLEGSEARHTTEQQALTKKLEDAKACHITEQRKLTNKLEGAEARHTTEQQALTKKLEGTEARHTTEQQGLTKKLESAEARHTTEQRELTKKLESAEARYTTERRELTKKFESAEARHTTEQRALTQKLENAEARYTTEQQALMQKQWALNAMATQKEFFRSELDSVRDRKKIVEGNLVETHSEISILNKKLAACESRSSVERQNLAAKQTELKALISEQQKTKAELQAVRDEKEKIENCLTTAQDEIAGLRQDLMTSAELFYKECDQRVAKQKELYLVIQRQKMIEAELETARENEKNLESSLNTMLDERRGQKEALDAALDESKRIESDLNSMRDAKMETENSLSKTRSEKMELERRRVSMLEKIRKQAQALDMAGEEKQELQNWLDTACTEQLALERRLKSLLEEHVAQEQALNAAQAEKESFKNNLESAQADMRALETSLSAMFKENHEQRIALDTAWGEMRQYDDSIDAARREMRAIVDSLDNARHDVRAAYRAKGLLETELGASARSTQEVLREKKEKADDRLNTATAAKQSLECRLDAARETVQALRDVRLSLEKKPNLPLTRNTNSVELSTGSVCGRIHAALEESLALQHELNQARGEVKHLERCLDSELDEKNELSTKLDRARRQLRRLEVCLDSESEEKSVKHKELCNARDESFLTMGTLSAIATTLVALL